MTGSGYRNILVPTDGNDLELEALREGLTLAELSDATIYVLYVSTMRRSRNWRPGQVSTT